MRTKDEIIRAHDTLVSILAGETDVSANPEEQIVLAAGLDALCWVLGHDHNPQFESNLDMLRGKLKEAGYVQIRDEVTN
jgi:hypothetical protein